MTSEQLRARIRNASVSFTDGVIAAFGEAFARVAADFGVSSRANTPKATAVKPAAPAPKKPAAPAPKKPAAPAPKKPAAPAPNKVGNKRIRRSLEQLAKDGEQVIQLLAANKKGLRIEAINKVLGTTTRELMRPIQKLLDEKKIRKSGDRRATVYFPG